MAIMSRKKQAVARNWDYLNKKVDEANNPKEKREKEEIIEEKHEEKIKMLREIGLLKD